MKFPSQNIEKNGIRPVREKFKNKHSPCKHTNIFIASVTNTGKTPLIEIVFTLSSPYQREKYSRCSQIKYYLNIFNMGDIVSISRLDLIP